MGLWLRMKVHPAPSVRGPATEFLLIFGSLKANFRCVLRPDEHTINKKIK